MHVCHLVNLFGWSACRVALERDAMICIHMYNIYIYICTYIFVGVQPLQKRARQDYSERNPKGGCRIGNSDIVFKKIKQTCSLLLG